MNIIEVQTNLQKVTNARISLAQIGEVLGVSRAAISKRAQIGRDLKISELEQIGNKFNIDLISMSEEISQKKKNIINEVLNNKVDTVEIDYYPDILVSCGNGIFPLGETKEKITVMVSMIKNYSKSKKYIVLNAHSDSMQPEIKPKDLLIVKVAEMEEIIDNHIYVFCHEDRVYCKYLSYNVGQVVVRSANPDYPTRYIEKEQLEDFRLVGEVCGHFRNYLL